MDTKYFTFTDGPHGASLRIRDRSGSLRGQLNEITNAVAQLCIDDGACPILEITSRTEIDGATEAQILQKATDLLAAKGGEHVDWVKE